MAHPLTCYLAHGTRCCAPTAPLPHTTNITPHHPHRPGIILYCFHRTATTLTRTACTACTVLPPQVREPVRGALQVRPTAACTNTPAVVKPAWVAGRGPGAEDTDLLLMVTSDIYHAGCKGAPSCAAAMPVISHSIRMCVYAVCGTGAWLTLGLGCGSWCANGLQCLHATRVWCSVEGQSLGWAAHSSCHNLQPEHRKPTPLHCAGGVLAWAAACDYELNTWRPILGVVNVCAGLFINITNTTTAANAAASSTAKSASTAASGVRRALESVWSSVRWVYRRLRGQYSQEEEGGTGAGRHAHGDGKQTTQPGGSSHMGSHEGPMSQHAHGSHPEHDHAHGGLHGVVHGDEQTTRDSKARGGVHVRTKSSDGVHRRRMDEAAGQQQQTRHQHLPRATAALPDTFSADTAAGATAQHPRHLTSTGSSSDSPSAPPPSPSSKPPTPAPAAAAATAPAAAVSNSTTGSSSVDSLLDELAIDSLVHELVHVLVGGL